MEPLEDFKDFSLAYVFREANGVVDLLANHRVFQNEEDIISSNPNRWTGQKPSNKERNKVFEARTHFKASSTESIKATETYTSILKIR
ncbi:hypothetical protein SUGI_0580180 [Cryptomeria japonica]|nr:hypothetical protein SUGI_0580180 [Cryptomeria japonica]